MVAPSELPARWREEAEKLRERYGLEELARTCEAHARELEASLNHTANELLNLRQAAAESGYSPDHLGELVREGRIPNAGRKNAPKIRRADVPVKPGHGPPAVAEDAPDDASVRSLTRRAIRSLR